ncbi:hypothetical protein ABUK39_06180, partial [Xanthomonas citri pv. mangiferaeindicae]
TIGNSQVRPCRSDSHQLASTKAGAIQITAVRFVFPPYQVGPYSDGTQMAEVAASTLLPSVAPEYVHLFAR